MVGILRTRWDNSKVSVARHKQDKLSNFILRQKKLGIPTSQTIEFLIKRGIPYDRIRVALRNINKARARNKTLDWSSVTSINETGRMIRNDIRRGKVTYRFGMLRLLDAYRKLKTIVVNPRVDKRLKQIIYEIQLTKKLLKHMYGNPETVQQYRTF